MINPELRRNIWIDFTLHRSLLTVVTAILIAYLFYLMGTNETSANISFDMACFFIFLWGTKKASESVIEEVNNNTWDFLRQSAISPWSITWGKLLGSTAFSWYGAGLSLCLYTFMREAPTVQTQHLTLFQEILILVLGGLFGQAIAIILSMQNMFMVRHEKNNKSFRYFVLGALSGIFMTSYCFLAIKHANMIEWHHIPIANDTFAYITLILFLGWALLALQRLFSKELQYQHIPWAWFGFNVFCIVYFSGFVSFEDINLEKITLGNIALPQLEYIKQQISLAPFYIAFFTAQLLTYIALFGDELTTVRYKRFISRISETNIKESLQQLPWWIISFVLTTITALIITFQQPPANETMGKFSLSILMLTSILFLIRDLLVVHYFCFGNNPRRAFGSAVLYLFLLYLLIPMLLVASHLNNLLPLLLPSYGDHTGAALLSLLIQFCFLGYICHQRWKTSWKSLKESTQK